MRALDHKLIRELWRLRGQVIAVAMVIGSGVGVLVMSLSTLDALSETAQTYYERYRFADVFASATRAPERIAGQIADVPGVQFVQTRITRFATLNVPGFAEPVIGQLMSIPEDGQPQLNQLVLRSGRWITRDRSDEVIVSEPFAEAHGIALGDRFDAVINGRQRSLAVVGTALSPEFIYTLGPGSLLPDDKRFGVVWIGRAALEAAFDLKNAFNDVAVTLLRDTEPEPVIERIKTLLEPYGGITAVARADQLSNWFVMNELEQIKTLSSVLPALFLSVAAFLCYMVLARLIATERGEIGLLKAFGYRNFEIGLHYAKFVFAIAVLGCAAGWLVGSVLGRHNTQMYAEFFRFPILIYRPSGSAFVIAAAVTTLATLVGALTAVRRAVGLPPAEAMRPPAPAVYRKGLLARLGVLLWLDQPTRIALRQIGRWPMRAALTCTGIALSVGLLIMALQWGDSVENIAQMYFYDAQHQSMTVGFAEPLPSGVVEEFRQMPGVMMVEPMRIVPADLSVGTHRHRGSVVGLEAGSVLQPVHDDRSGEDIEVPQAGLALGSKLAEKLGVGVGDSVWVEVLEGSRPQGAMPVIALFDTTIAMPAYMSLDSLNRWLEVRPSVEYVNLWVDPSAEAELFPLLKETPKVSAVMLRRAAIDAFYATLVENLMTFTTIFTGFALALGFGVAYNSTRIALSERGRELATLRVLGFTRGEISYILLGEVALLILAALPLGCLAGRALTLVIGRAFDTELYRVPMVVEASTYGLSVVFAIVATTASAALVRRRLQHLDLIRVLKTRE